MGDRLDTDRRRLIWFRFPVTRCQSFRLGSRSATSAFVSASWWYWASTEEASALA